MTQPALDLVIAALQTIRENSDRAPRVSRAALARLQAAPATAQAPALRTAHATPADAVEYAVPRGVTGEQDKAQLVAEFRELVRVFHKCVQRECLCIVD